MSEKVVVRFPPSPTGPFHVGSARTALFNFLFAKKNGGKFVLRIEDTDKERSKIEYENDILESLKWLGLPHDNHDIPRQSERVEIYKKYIQKMLDSGSAYISKEEKTEERQRSEVIRFKNPNKKIKFNDLIRGDIEFDTTELGDFVVAKSILEPVYHLAVVVDDFEMGVTHILRGEDGISNTPRQILIQEAIEAPRPTYAHLPLMLDTDKAKLSKRKHGEKVSVSYYKNAGYLPEAMINFLALIGWNPGTEQEIFSMEELIQHFDTGKVQKKGAIFNTEKLDWINREYILHLPNEEKLSAFKIELEKSKWASHEKTQDEVFIQKLFDIIIDRIHKWGEARESLDEGEYDYLFQAPLLDTDKICWKDQSKDDAHKNLKEIVDILSHKHSEDDIMKLAEREGKGNVLWPLRYILSGREKSPDPMTLLRILGTNESKSRISEAIKLLSA
jgi:glutamyl-tRNA synthetase